MNKRTTYTINKNKNVGITEKVEPVNNKQKECIEYEEKQENIISAEYERENSYSE